VQKPNIRLLHNHSGMSTEMGIADNRRLAEISESEIRKRLSCFSIPMKPAPQFDIGIDFYCELSTNNPLLPKIFYVQAKGTRQFKKAWGRSVEKRTIRLWLNQPFPVYIVVYDAGDRECYWSSIEEQRKILLQKLESNKKTVYVKVGKSNILEEGENPQFISALKQDFESINFRLNLVRGVPHLIGNGYVKTRPLLFLSNPLIAIIRDRIRQSMGYLITHFLLKGDIEKGYFLCEFLTKFDKGHYDHFVLFGNICKLIGKQEEACSSYRKAIDICKGDKNWNKLKGTSDPSIEDIITKIEKEMKSINC